MLKRITFLSSSLLLTLLLTSGVLSDNGKAGKTGSPGELTCLDCHNNFSLGAGGGSIGLSSTNMTNWEYVPGTTYHMIATVSRTGTNLFGIGLECLTSTNTNAGTLTITNTSTSIKNATVNAVSRRNVVHTLNGGASANSKAFAFDWVAPGTNIGNVTFYYSGVAANGDGNEEIGDYVYAGSQVVTPAISTGITELEPGVDVNVYPNPATDLVRVDYALSDAVDVEITLFDAQGRMAGQLVNAKRQPGRHSEMIGDLGRFASGTYTLRTRLGDRSVERRIVLGTN